MRSVSILQVSDVAVWRELEALGPVAEHTEATDSPLRRVAAPTFEAELLPLLRGKGATILVRYPRRTVAEVREQHDHLAEAIARLAPGARLLLHAAQGMAFQGEILGAQVWDPEEDVSAVRELVAAELVAPLAHEAEVDPWSGRFQLHPDLPAPPPRVWHFDDALMPPPDDLDAGAEGGGALGNPEALLHDLASLAASVIHVGPRRTLGTTLRRVDARRLGDRLGSDVIARTGDLEGDPRWGRALRGLEALGGIGMDPIKRELFVDLGLEAVLVGSTSDALGRLVTRLMDRDLVPLVGVIRQALVHAGDQALDEVVFAELIREQHRDLLFRPWVRGGGPVYPHLGDGEARPFDDAGFEAVEASMVSAVLRRLYRLGLLRRADGVFAPTAAGSAWAGGEVDAPPIWITSDLEIVVPPGAITPWERLQIERLGRCVGRDVVDRYRLDRSGLATWLATHDLDDALALLKRRSPAVPESVVETLTIWADAAQRVVLIRGVLVDDKA